MTHLLFIYQYVTLLPEKEAKISVEYVMYVLIGSHLVF